MNASPHYIKLLADGYEAVVPLDLVEGYSSSHLAELVQVVLEQGTADPAVRLQCDAEEAKEVVKVLRQVCLASWPGSCTYVRHVACRNSNCTAVALVLAACLVTAVASFW
jgi:hypothetical protein